MQRTQQRLSVTVRNALRTVITAVAAAALWGSFPSGQSVDYGGYRPHYQGFGVDTQGGRGGIVCKVTSLEDEGAPRPGTLRHCVETSRGPRFVVFEISGTITLRRGPLVVRHPYVTIAGQTAPSPGILIRGQGLVVDTHDVVIQHVRVRVGNVRGEPVGVWLRDGATRVVVDHVSISWSVWTALAVAAYSPGRPPGEVTIIDSIVSESLGCSGVNTSEPCDPANYPRRGASNSRAIGVGDAWKHEGPQVALVRTISAHNNDRHPEIGGRSETFLVNNLIYNPSQTPLSAIFFQDAGKAGPALSVVQGNVLIPGPTTPGHQGYVPNEYAEDGEVMLVRIHPTVHDGSRIYLDGNYDPRHCAGTLCLESPAAQWMLARDYKRDWERVDVRALSPPLLLSNLPLSSALPYNEVEPYLLANAGARPLDRDAVDARLIQEIASRTGSVPNRTSDKAGPGTTPDGFPVLAVNRRALQVPSRPAERADDAGRTRIEAWLEAFARELEPARR